MHTPQSHPKRLVGRHDEMRRIDELLSSALSGSGGSLVLRGEAGIGKSALLRYAASAEGVRVVQVSGSQFEEELPYAALHQLCKPLLDQLNKVPDRHREALRVAFGIADGTPEPFRIGLAVLDLVTSLARDQAMLLLVDDAQWLDVASARALVFVARRVEADHVAVIFASRSPVPPPGLRGLAQVEVRGLTDEQARALLVARTALPLDDEVRDRLISEARGNPLALLQLPRAGGFEVPHHAAVADPIALEYPSRLTGMATDARMLLILASADPTGDPALLWSAADRLGLDREHAIAEADASGLVNFAAHVRFCHPLARSGVYWSAGSGERRAAHRALAEVTDEVLAPDRRAWHRAQAAVGQDDELATDMERCAPRARARGGIAAAAAFLDRSVALTIDSHSRIDRILAAAEAHLEAGDDQQSADLLILAESRTLNEDQEARIELLRGRTALSRPGDDSGPALILHAARRLAGLDPNRARDHLMDAIEMSLAAGYHGTVTGDVISAVRSDAPPANVPDALDAMVTLAEQGVGAAAPALAKALEGAGEPLWERRPALAAMIAVELWDLAAYTTIAKWLMKVGRESGSSLMLRLGLAQKAMDAVLAGDIACAITAVEEESALTDAVGDSPLLYHRLHLTALRGHVAEFSELAGTMAESSADRGLTVNAHWASAVLNNGTGNFPAALASARTAVGRDQCFLHGVILPELIEAAVRCQEHGIARSALESLTAHAQATRAPWGLGVASSARGMVTGVESHYREGIEYLEAVPSALYSARAHLVYGEWLRRKRRRKESRTELRLAFEAFSAMGAEGFARRAADELRSTGERIADTPESSYERLSEKEFAVARLVAAGSTSKEVAAQLFLSKRTVDAHLRNIFRKLGVDSRSQLRDHAELRDGPLADPPPAEVNAGFNRSPQK